MKDDIDLEGFLQELDIDVDLLDRIPDIIPDDEKEISYKDKKLVIDLQDELEW